MWSTTPRRSVPNIYRMWQVGVWVIRIIVFYFKNYIAKFIAGELVYSIEGNLGFSSYHAKLQQGKDAWCMLPLSRELEKKISDEYLQN